MTEEFTIHEISLGFPHDKEMLIRFLSEHELVFEDDIETAFGVFDQDEALLGCGCGVYAVLSRIPGVRRWLV